METQSFADMLADAVHEDPDVNDRTVHESPRRAFAAVVERKVAGHSRNGSVLAYTAWVGELDLQFLEAQKRRMSSSSELKLVHAAHSHFARPIPGR